jgi:hypothetical protein
MSHLKGNRRLNLVNDGLNDTMVESIIFAFVCTWYPTSFAAADTGDSIIFATTHTRNPHSVRNKQRHNLERGMKGEGISTKR